MSAKSDSINRQRVMDMKGHNEVLMRDIKKDRGAIPAKKVYSKEVLQKFGDLNTCNIDISISKYFK